MKDSLKDAMLIFTDGSSNEKAEYVVDDKGYGVWTDPASAQIVGLWAIAVVMQLNAENAFNLNADSHYIVKALQVTEL